MSSMSVTKIVDKINKKHGTGSIMTLQDRSAVKVETISTGSILLDTALGVGGLPRGRIVEIYGPESSGKTTVCLTTVANVQRAGYKAAFIDVENSLDPIYAKALGVQLDGDNALMISQPNSGEEALNIVEDLIDTGEMGIVVVDSVSALVPQAELNGEIGDSHVGLQARLMSQAMRKLTSKVKKCGTILFFTNQLRMKIGVMFGCVHYDGRIICSTGKGEKIGKIVNQKEEIQVKTYDFEKHLCENKTTLRRFNNGFVSGEEGDIFLQIVTESLSGSGRRNVPLTPNHTVYRVIDNEIKECLVSQLDVGDNLLHRAAYKDSKMLRKFIIGSMLGDGSLRNEKKRNTCAMAFGHSIKQKDYCFWKYEILSDIVHCKFDERESVVGFCTEADARFADLYRKHCIGKCSNKRKARSNIADLIKGGDLLSLAVWYMDDGTFGGSYKLWGWGKSVIACRRFTQKKKGVLADWLERLVGVRPTLSNSGLLFSGWKNRVFQEKIAPYVHPSMDYKLHPKMRKLFDKTLYEHKVETVETVCPVKIVEIYKKPCKYVREGENGRKIYKYDLETKDNHNYFVDEILVHNSPETTSGGNALKFYASVRMDIRRISKADAEADNTTVKIKVVKNKVAPPFRIAETKIYFGKGFDRYSEILKIGLNEDVVEKRGSWFSCGDTQLGQGFDASVEFLRGNPDFAEDIYKCALEEEEEEDTTVEDEIKRLQKQLEEEEDVTSIKELRKQIKKLKKGEK